MQQKLFKNAFSPQEAGAFRNSIEKKPQKPSPKLKKYVCYIFTDNIFSVCDPKQEVFFCKNVVIL